MPPPPEVITHCRRELYHAVIKLILEGEFAKAYKEGILIKFPDGITRRVFPRFYCYTADYPEKYVKDLKVAQDCSPEIRVLIATIKNMGCCPCPRCKVKLANVQHMGKTLDTQTRMDVRERSGKLLRGVKMARKAVFAGFKVNGSRIEKLLGKGSGIPINVSCFTVTVLLESHRYVKERIYQLSSWPQHLCSADGRFVT